MMLKKPKDQVLSDVKNAAVAAAYQANNIHLSVDDYQLQQAFKNAIQLNGQYNLQQAIGDAVGAAFEKLMESMYFDSEFENDLGITKHT